MASATAVAHETQAGRMADGEVQPSPAAATRRIEFRRRGNAIPLRGVAGVVAAVALLATAGSMLWMYFHRLGKNPAGFFCDEAQIGIRTWQLLHGTLPAPSPRFPAFYEHIDYTIGAFSLYFGAPFIALFGPTEAAVRVSATVAMVIGLAALVLLTVRLGLRNGWIGVLVFGLSPIGIHMARFNMAHPHGFMLSALGFLLYAVARQQRSAGWALGAGAILGMAVYANVAWYIATPVTIGCLGLGELISNGVVLARWRTFALSVAGTLLIWIPLFHRMLTDESFFNRFKEKQGIGAAPLLSRARLDAVLDAYPKYFSLDYLFRTGESGGILRHSVPGAGLFPWLILPLVLLGIVAILWARRGPAKVIGIAAVAMLVLYPAPDILTTNPLAPPYTFAVFSMFLCVPVLCAFGVSLLSRWIGGSATSSWRQAVVPVALSALLLAGAWTFYRGPYADYPNVSAGYYGWQFGPGPAIAAFLADNNQHDHYYLDSDFNGAYVFPDFSLLEHPEMAAKTSLGAPHERAVPTERALYAVKPERWAEYVGPLDPIRRYAVLQDVIYYPDGTPAMLILSISLQNPPQPILNW